MKNAFEEILKRIFKLAVVLGAFGLIYFISPAASAAVIVMIIIYYSIIKP